VAVEITLSDDEINFSSTSPLNSLSNMSLSNSESKKLDEYMNVENPIPGIQVEIKEERLKDPNLMPPTFVYSVPAPPKSDRVSPHQVSVNTRTISRQHSRQAMKQSSARFDYKQTDESVQEEKIVENLNDVETDKLNHCLSNTQLENEIDEYIASEENIFETEEVCCGFTKLELAEVIFEADLVLAARSTAIAMLLQFYERCFTWNTFSQ
ncbi:hypothetical protein HK096_000479, partial [Nowakowskiella sp. JEL0078]